jgi:TonB-linked SusC/RagA family outer membrane protein
MDMFAYLCMRLTSYTKLCAILTAFLLAAPLQAAPEATPPDAPTEAVGAIAGTVVDASTAQPLSGVAIRIVDLELSTLTDEQGRFAISNVPEGTHQVQASRLGYAATTVEVTVETDETSMVEIQMEQQAVGLDELVVTSYAPRMRQTRAGAQGRIEGEAIDETPIQTVDQALQGTVPGVQVTQVSGQPGGGTEVRIRGLGSIEAGNEPLYIVDGVQLSSRQAGNQNQRSVLAGLNPRDIESIEVLKDAAATSIYGAQAANGVVLISTRRGQAGETQWSFSTEAGVVDDVNRWSVLNGPEWVRMQMDAFGNRAVDLGQPRSQGEQQAVQLYGEPSQAPSFDWQDAVRHQGVIRSVDASVSGGSTETRFYLSGGYDYEESQQIETSFERASARANLEHQASDQVSLLTNVGFSSATQFGQVGTVCANCPLNFANQIAPIMPIRNEDGSFNTNVLPFPYSPVFQAHEEIQKGVSQQLTGNATVNVSLTPELNFRSLWGLDHRIDRNTRFRPPDQPFIGDFLSEGHTGITNWNTNQVLNYVTPLGDEQQHTLSALGGVEYREESLETFGAIGAGLPRPSGLFRTLSLASDARSNSGSTSGFKVASAFGRLEYDHGSRFSFSDSLRYDGSSRFGQDHQWRLFYSGSAAWDIGNKAFLQDVDWLDALELRTSYGITGNSAIGDFEALTLFGSGGSYANQPALRPAGLGNNLLTWEEAETLNIGLGWDMLDGRLSGNLDVFRTNNRDLLLGAFLPSHSGFSSVTRNAGVVRNQGVEFQITGVPVLSSDVSWETSLTFGYYDNEIMELVGGQQNIGNNIRVGHPLRIYWGPRWAGVNPADGRPMWYDANGDITYQVSSDDSQVLGSPLPDVEGGWNNVVTAGPVSMRGTFKYSLGQDVFIGDLPTLLNSGSGGNVVREIEDRWREPGDVTNVPKAYTTAGQPGTSAFTTFSDRFIDDGSYIRLKNLRLSYRLPESLTASLGGFTGTVYAAGYNLLTITEYGGPDPEVHSATTGSGGNTTTWTSTRQFRFGFEVRK